MSSKSLQLEKVHTDHNGSKMMAKALPIGKLDVFHSFDGMKLLLNEANEEICWV